MRGFALPMADRPNSSGAMCKLSLQWLPQNRDDLVFVVEPRRGGQRSTYPAPLREVVDLLSQKDADLRPISDRVVAGTEFGIEYLSVELADFEPFFVHSDVVKALLRQVLPEVADEPLRRAA
jgi:hypothetical protein